MWVGLVKLMSCKVWRWWLINNACLLLSGSQCVCCLGCQTGCRWGFSDLFINPSGDLMRTRVLTHTHTHMLKYILTPLAWPIGTHHCRNISEDYNRNVFFSHAHTPVISHTLIRHCTWLYKQIRFCLPICHTWPAKTFYILTECARTLMLNSVHIFIIS